MERLSALDASFLRVESPSAHMHVGWLSDLTLPPGEEELDAAGLAMRVEGRLHHAPRFRQRVSRPMVGEPVWVDDPGFRLDRHVQVAGVVNGPAELRQLCGDFLSRQLSRSFPLWEILIVPRVGSGKAAVLGK